MTRRFTATVASIAAAALYAGLIAACSQADLKPLPTVGSDSGDVPIANPSFSRDIQPIFSDRCAIPACHIAPTAANFGLALTDAETSYANLVKVDSKLVPGQPRVDPGSAANSFLVSTLQDQPVLMPLQGPPLSQGTIDTIVNWINQGAAKN